MNKKDPELTCFPDGPYHICNCEITNSKEENLLSEEEAYLCRCGGSSSKPFCDGTHLKNDFSDKNLNNGKSDKRENYPGKRITIHDNRGICSHAGFCTDGLSAVFKMKEEPWIDPDGAEVEEIINTIKKCPSGALSYSIDDVEHRDRMGKPLVKVTKNGPYAFSGGIRLNNQAQGEGASAEHFTLCRCGGSKNKPFCDGTHWHIGFEDEKN